MIQTFKSRFSQLLADIYHLSVFCSAFIFYGALMLSHTILSLGARCAHWFDARVTQTFVRLCVALYELMPGFLQSEVQGVSLHWNQLVRIEQARAKRWAVYLTVAAAISQSRFKRLFDGSAFVRFWQGFVEGSFWISFFRAFFNGSASKKFRDTYYNFIFYNAFFGPFLAAIGAPFELISHMLHAHSLHYVGNYFYALAFRAFDPIFLIPNTLYTLASHLLLGTSGIGSSMVIASSAISNLLHGEYDDFLITDYVAFFDTMFNPFLGDCMSVYYHCVGGLIGVVGYATGWTKRATQRFWYINVADLSTWVYNTHISTKLTAFWVFVLNKAGYAEALPPQFFAAQPVSPAPTAADLYLSPTRSPFQAHGHLVIDTPASLDVIQHVPWQITVSMIAMFFVFALMMLTRSRKVNLKAPGCHFVSSADDDSRPLPFWEKRSHAEWDSYYSVEQIGLDRVILAPCAANYHLAYSARYIYALELKFKIILLEPEHLFQNRRVYRTSPSTRGTMLQWFSEERTVAAYNARKRALSSKDPPQVLAPRHAPFGKTYRVGRILSNTITFDPCQPDDTRAHYYSFLEELGNRGYISLEAAKYVDQKTLVYTFVERGDSSVYDLFTTIRREMPDMKMDEFMSICHDLADDRNVSKVLARVYGGEDRFYPSGLEDYKPVDGVFGRVGILFPNLKAKILATAFMMTLDKAVREICPEYVYEVFFRETFANAANFAGAIEKLQMLPSIVNYIVYGIGNVNDLNLDPLSRCIFMCEEALAAHRTIGYDGEVVDRLKAAGVAISEVLLTEIPTSTRTMLHARLAAINAIALDAASRAAKTQSVNILLVSNCGRVDKSNTGKDILRHILKRVHSISAKDAILGSYQPDLDFQTTIFPGTHGIQIDDPFKSSVENVQSRIASLIHALCGGEVFEMPQAAIERKGHISTHLATVLTSNVIGMQIPENVMSNEVQFQQRFHACVEVIVNGQRGSDGHSTLVEVPPGKRADLTYDVTIWKGGFTAQNKINDRRNVYGFPDADSPYAPFCGKDLDYTTMLYNIGEIAKLQHDFNASFARRPVCSHCGEVVCVDFKPAPAVGQPAPYKNTINESLKPQNPKRHPRRQDAAVETFEISSATESFVEFNNAFGNNDNSAAFFSLLSGSATINPVVVVCIYFIIAILFAYIPWYFAFSLALLFGLAVHATESFVKAIWYMQKYIVVRRFYRKVNLVGQKGFATLSELKFRFGLIQLSDNQKLFLCGVSFITMVLLTVGLVRMLNREDKQAATLAVSGSSVSQQVVSPPAKQASSGDQFLDALVHVTVHNGERTFLATGCLLDTMTVLFPGHLLNNGTSGGIFVNGKRVALQMVHKLVEADVAIAILDVPLVKPILHISKWATTAPGGTGVVYALRDSGVSYATPVSGINMLTTTEQAADVQAGVKCFEVEHLWTHGECGAVLVNSENRPIGIAVAANFLTPELKRVPMCRNVRYVAIAELKPFLVPILANGFSLQDYASSAAEITTVLPPNSKRTSKLSSWEHDLTSLGLQAGFIQDKIGQKPSVTKMAHEFSEAAANLAGLRMQDVRLNDGGSLYDPALGRKVNPVELYVNDSKAACAHYMQVGPDDSVTREQVESAIRDLLRTCPHQIERQPVDFETAIKGTKLVPGMELSTSAGIGAGKKSKFIEKQVGGVQVPTGLMVRTLETYERITKCLTGPVCLSLNTKRDEVMLSSKIKMRTINAPGDLSRTIAQRMLFLPLIEFLVLNGSHLGMMPGINMHDPVVVEALYKQFDGVSASDDIKRMEAFHAATVKYYTTFFWKTIAQLVGYTPELIAAVQHECAAMDYPAILIGDEIMALGARNASGHMVTTWANTIRVLVVLIAWCLRYGKSLEKIARLLYGDDMTRKHEELADYESFAKYAAHYGFQITSAIDKTQLTTPAGIDKLEFLKRRLEVRDGVYYAPLGRFSVLKSLMFLKFRKINGECVLDPVAVKGTLMSAKREAYIGGYSDINALCNEMATAHGLDLTNMDQEMHEQYLARQFTFDYVPAA